MRLSGLRLKSVASRERKAEESCRDAHNALNVVEATPAVELIRQAIDLPSPLVKGASPSARNKEQQQQKLQEQAPSQTYRTGASTAVLSARALMPTSEPPDNPHLEVLIAKAIDEVPRREASLGPFHPATIDTVHRLGLLLYRAGRYEEAKKHLHRVTEHRTAYLGVAHVKTLQALADESKCVDAQKRRAIANAAAEEAAEDAAEDAAGLRLGQMATEVAAWRELDAEEAEAEALTRQARELGLGQMATEVAAAPLQDSPMAPL